MSIVGTSGRAATFGIWALMSFEPAAWATGDAVRGATLFQACAACHSAVAGEHLTGPSLAHVWQHKAGTVAGFQRYSDAMKRVDIVWTLTTLDKWLTNPEALIPGTTMTFAGMRDGKAREDVIAYLKAVSEGKPPEASQRGGGGGGGGGGMMANMQRGRVDLKSAAPEGQVTAIKHCGDTYAVSTADGKVNKVWEFNLRFKTDGSRFGPSSGKPVMVGAGMQGDRASIVFAAPAEISRFIADSCT